MLIRHFLLGLLVVLLWGFNFVVIKIGLTEISPLLLCTIRFFLASLPAIFFKFPATSFHKVILYGLVMFAVQFALLFWGMHAGVTAGLAALLLQAQVFFTVILAIFFLGEKLKTFQALGSLISFGGLAFVATNIGGSVTTTGFLLLMAAAIAWSFGNIISKKIDKVNMLSLVTWSSLVAWPPLLAATLLLDGPTKTWLDLQNMTWISVGALLYITYGSTLLGFGIWNYLLHLYNLHIIAPFTLLVPIVAMISSMIVLHEPLHSWKIWASLLVIAGLSINFFGSCLFSKKRS